MITRAQIDDLAKNDPKELIDHFERQAPLLDITGMALVLEKLGEVQEDFVPRARTYLKQFITAPEPILREASLLALCTLALQYWDEEDIKCIESCLEDKDQWVKRVAVDSMMYIRESASWIR